MQRSFKTRQARALRYSVVFLRPPPPTSRPRGSCVENATQATLGAGPETRVFPSLGSPVTLLRATKGVIKFKKKKKLVKFPIPTDTDCGRYAELTGRSLRRAVDDFCDTPYIGTQT